MPNRRIRIAAAAGTLVLCALAFAFSGPLSRGFVAAAIDIATGYRVEFSDLDLRTDRAIARNVQVANGGRTLLVAERIAVRYRLRDLLPGGLRRFGFVGIELDAPRIVLERRADGSFSVPAAAQGPVPGAPAAAGPAGRVPLRFSARVRDGSLVLEDRFRVLPESRRLALAGLAGTLAFDDTGVTKYQLSATVPGDAAGALSVAGRIDSPRGYALHRIRARGLAIAPFVNYFINSTGARFESGVAQALDVRLYGFASGPDRRLEYHVAGTLALQGGGMRVPGLVPSASEVTGRVDVYDGGLAAPSLSARLGTLPVRVAGALYDWTQLNFRLGVAVEHAPLDQARSLFAFSRDLPLAGEARLTTLLEGPVAQPLAATWIASSPAVAYASVPLDGLRARAIYYDGALDIVGFTAGYGGLAIGANGSVALGNVVRTRLVVDVAGPAGRVPYLAALAPGASLEASGLLAGDGLRFDTRGAIGGTGRGLSLAGTFHENSRGEGSYGPFRVARDDGSSVAGAFTFERNTNESAFWLDARRYRYAQAALAPPLPGLALVAPAFRGTLDGALAGVGSPSDFRIAGDVRARDALVGSVALSDVGGHVVGRIGNFGLRGIVARGPWGTFAGDGAYLGPALALEGAYRGSFAQLQTLTGDVGASGPVSGPVALLIGPGRTVVQARGAATEGGRIRGVPVDGLSGTLAVTGKKVRIYAAEGAVAGGTLVAAGDLNGAASLGISLADAEAARLRGVVPLGGAGRVAAIGTFGAAGGRSGFDGGLAFGEGTTLDRLPVAANGDVRLFGTTFGFRQTDAQLGPALGSLDGSFAGIGTRSPHYDARLRILAARLGPFVRAALPQRRDVAGTLTGDLQVRGTLRNVALAGTVGIPEGTINGLAFRDASARISIAPGALTARAGTATIGSTRTVFGADVSGTEAAFHLEAPRADLDDFNDFFDAGDTLGGRGRVAAQFVRHGATVSTNADIAIAGLHVRRFDLGDASARWTSRGRDVTGRIAFGGASGRLETGGVLELPAQAPLDRLLARARFTGSARLRGLDLGVWLPALGYQVPVGGRVDADAAIAGGLRNPDVRTDATLIGGSFGKFPIERLVLSANSTLRRTTVSKAELEIPGLSLAGSGSFGFGAHDRAALAVHAKSSNVGALAARFLEPGLAASGVAEVDVKVDGTRARPRVVGGFDLEAASLRGVRVPRALGQFTLSGRDIVLSSVEVGFATGTLLLAGSVPLQVAPFGFGPPGAPISLDLAAKGIDFADFTPLLPAGSKVGGQLDGRVAVGGTAGAPRLIGSLSLSGGTLLSPLETIPLTGLEARLAFAGTEARLESVHAAAGGGTLDANGAASLLELVRPGVAQAYRFSAVAKRLRLNLPAYGAGQVDGTLALARAPASRPRLTGSLALSDATIPFAALLVSSGGDGGLEAEPAAAAAVRPNDVALDLTVSAERNVRVRSSNVDIGGRGDLHVGGTAGAPQLDGGFDSAGGTLTYFNTVFRLVDGRVSFRPDLGLVPTLDARAVTHVIDPDPNTVRNVAGAADVTLGLSGPVTKLSIALSSDPPYDRQQILGLLLGAPALGASNLFGGASGAPTPYGSTTLAGAPAGTLSARGNGQFSVAQEAFGIANAQFTRTLLAPIETSFAQAVGLSNFNVNVDYTGNVGVSARKVLGKKLNAVYGTSFGYPYRQTFGFEIKPNADTAAQVTVFQTLGATGLTSLAPVAFGANNLRLQAAQPSSGSVGFSLSLQRLFR